MLKVNERLLRNDLIYVAKLIIQSLLIGSDFLLILLIPVATTGYDFRYFGDCGKNFEIPVNHPNLFCLFGTIVAGFYTVLMVGLKIILLFHRECMYFELGANIFRAVYLVPEFCQLIGMIILRKSNPNFDSFLTGIGTIISFLLCFGAFRFTIFAYGYLIQRYTIIIDPEKAL